MQNSQKVIKELLLFENEGKAFLDGARFYKDLLIKEPEELVDILRASNWTGVTAPEAARALYATNYSTEALHLAVDVMFNTDISLSMPVLESIFFPAGPRADFFGYAQVLDLAFQRVASKRVKLQLPTVPGGKAVVRMLSFAGDFLKRKDSFSDPPRFEDDAEDVCRSRTQNRLCANLLCVQPLRRWKATWHRCSGCYVATYCSHECQREDWKFHKSFCKKQPGYACAKFIKA